MSSYSELKLFYLEQGSPSFFHHGPHSEKHQGDWTTLMYLIFGVFKCLKLALPILKMSYTDDKIGMIKPQEAA